MSNAKRVNAYLTVKDCRAAIAFYQQAFDARDSGPCIEGPNGIIAHAEVQIGDSVVMLADEDPDFGNVGPQTLGETTVRMNIEVQDADKFVARAAAAGAEIVIPVADQFYGERAGRLKDPFGHLWIVSQHVEDVGVEEMQRRADELFPRE